MEHLETRPNYTAALKAHGQENVLKKICASGALEENKMEQLQQGL